MHKKSFTVKKLHKTGFSKLVTPKRFGSSLVEYSRIRTF